jgi:Mce-associated membrane protein
VTDQTPDTRDIETVEAAQAVQDDPEATEKQESPSRTKRPPRKWSRMLRNVKLVPVILVVLLLISGGSAAWLYFKQYKPDQQTNPDVARTVVSAASDGTVALLSYSPESLEKDFAAAKSHLTGDFLSYYNQFTSDIVAPAAKQKSLKTTAQVMGAAVSELHPDSAVVLVFVDQSTTSKDKPYPSMAASDVLVSLTRVNSHWLITKFEPI